MTLNDIIKDIEKMGILVLLTDLPSSKGRHDEINGQKVIFLDKQLEDTQAINVLLHEKQHCLADDIHNSLTQVSTYSHRIEAKTEKNRIRDFLNLINTEYPIDETFNYIDYMRAAHIPYQFESFIKEIAQKTYQANQNRKKD